MSVKTFFGVDNQGGFGAQSYPALPAWAQGDEGRIAYTEEGQLYFADDSAWVLATLEQINSLANYNFFPEVLTSDGKMPVTAGSAQVSIGSGIGFFMRGSYYVTDNFTLDFATAANKTYHLRFVNDAGADGDNLGQSFYSGKGLVAPAFYLADLSDSTYTQGSAESSTFLDTRHDDMLVALVTTNASNVATIVPLVNKALLRAAGSSNSAVVVKTNWTAFPAGNITLNWSRAPEAPLIGLSYMDDWPNAYDSAITSYQEYYALRAAGVRAQFNRYVGNPLYIFDAMLADGLMTRTPVNGNLGFSWYASA